MAPAAPLYASGSPSGATAIIAAVLALLIGAARGYFSVGLIQGWYYVAKFSGDLGSYLDNSVFAWAMVYSVATVASTAALLLGGVLLLSRKRAGRTLIVLGCLIGIAESVVVWVAAASFLQSLSSLGDNSFGGALHVGMGTVIALAVPVATLVLALAPATARWCR
jgi:hypothetical protein